VATNDQHGFQLVTGGSPMTEGCHYWEMTVNSASAHYGSHPMCDMLVGAVHESQSAFYISGFGELYRNGKQPWRDAGKFATGDRIGVLLDLNAGWIRFYPTLTRRANSHCRQNFIVERASRRGLPPPWSVPQRCITETMPATTVKAEGDGDGTALALGRTVGGHLPPESESDEDYFYFCV
jgi:hypothetical protein